jgi:Peptidase family M48
VSELRRLELALGALAGSAVGVVAVAALDAALHHAALMPVVGAVAALLLARGLGSLARQLRGQRRLRELRARPAVVHGHAVLIVPGRMLGAFCAGLLRPAIYVTEATLGCAETELCAVLAHEEHHRRRRDPLRLALARAVSDAFRPLPLFATLADHHAALADLMADDAAMTATGGTRSLAAALARFDEHGAGVAPERVDRLVRTALPLTVPAALPVAAALALGGIAAPLLLGHHPGLEHLGLLAACLPACLAARRAAACLRVDEGSSSY